MTSRPLRTTAPINPRTRGERIRYARITAGMTQQGLADLIRKAGGTGVSKSLVSQWESGGVKDPTNDNLFAIGAVTGYSAEWLATGRGEMRASVAAAQSFDTRALARVLEAVAPDAGIAAKAAIVAALYDVVIDSPDVTDAQLSSFATAFSRKI